MPIIYENYSEERIINSYYRDFQTRDNRIQQENDRKRIMSEKIPWNRKLKKLDKLQTEVGPLLAIDWENFRKRITPRRTETLALALGDADGDAEGDALGQ